MGRYQLGQIEHIVVLMLENRSFDHMLGYLRLEGGRNDIEGLTGTESNTYEGKEYPVYPLTIPAIPWDPCHASDCVERQLKDKNSGFVEDYALQLEQTGEPFPAPNFPVMGYYTANDLPAYDFLAGEFCVADHWFSSVRGQTWPNRFYALSGDSRGEKDIPSGLPLPLYGMPTIFEFLKKAGRSWQYFSHNIAFLRLYERYSVSDDNIDKIDLFYELARSGELPDVSWIDPHFTGFGGDGNDDHPPADVRDGQRLVARVYDALIQNEAAWQKTLFIVTYDEHGGFYDHVVPPAAEDDRAGFESYGVRVPAFLISPFVPRASVTKRIFDHTSILKTILARFCRQPDGSLPHMSRRVDFANDLSDELSLDAPRASARMSKESAQSLAASAAGSSSDAVGSATGAPKGGTGHGALMEKLAQHVLARGAPAASL